MPTVPFLGSYGDISGSGLMFRNKLINGGFDIWQYATTQTTTRFYGSDDRWNNDFVGSSRTHSQQTFTLGQTDVPGNPRFFSRTVSSSVAGAGNYVAKYQKIEGVRTFAGQTVTLSFWAKADAARNIATSVDQFFGSGGSPSSGVTGIAPATHALTTSWKYFTSTFTLPSISGKTIGTNNNDCLTLLFWFDAGSTFNSQTNSLGQQSGTFDIANVQLEAGPVATPFEQRPIGTEWALCQRYCYVIPADAAMGFAFVKPGGTSSDYFYFHPVIMRGNPAVTSIGGTTSFSLFPYSGGSTSTSTFSTPFANTRRILLLLSGHGALTVGTTASVDIGTAPLAVSAEL